jgi:hypothetical protein
LHEAGIETAAAKSHSKRNQMDALRQKGPVGGGAGGKAQGAKGKISKDKGGGSNSDNESGNEEETSLPMEGTMYTSDPEEQEPKDLDIITKEFQFTNNQQRTGYFLGHYNNNNKGSLEQFEVKETLVDFLDTTLKYIYDNYGHHGPTVKYIERVCLSMWTFPKSNLKHQVVMGFKMLIDYVKFMVWPRLEHQWQLLVSAKGANIPNPKVLYPCCDKPKWTTPPKGRSGKNDQETFAAPMKSSLVFKDGVLQLW